MIKSILDTDLYKFSTSYAYFKLYPNAEGVFEFTDRREESWEPELKDKLIEMFNKQINEVKELSLTDDEMCWCIENIPYIPATYWEWLSTFRFNPLLIKGLDNDSIPLIRNEKGIADARNKYLLF